MVPSPAAVPRLLGALGLALVLTAAAPAGVVAADAAAPASGTVTYDLKNGATLRVDAADSVTLDRKTLNEISIEVSGDIDPSLEAVWDGADLSVYFEHEPVGFVRMDDWDELDVDELWQSYLEGAAEQSAQFGFEVTPLRWVIAPTLNRADAVAYYAIEIAFGDEPPVVNLVIYDFGRYGYEEITLVQDSALFPAADADAIATRIAGAYAFGPDSRYADAKEGDVIAASGAAGLVAASLGVKFGKGFIVAALLLVKKFWFLLLALPALAWKWLRGLVG